VGGHKACSARQERKDSVYQDAEQWALKAICNETNMRAFFSDRGIPDYPHNIWDMKLAHA
jgi:starch phosphorylase